jgi:hypothetical protein
VQAVLGCWDEAYLARRFGQWSGVRGAVNGAVVVVEHVEHGQMSMLGQMVAGERNPRYGGDVVVGHPIGRQGNWQARRSHCRTDRRAKASAS